MQVFGGKTKKRASLVQAFESLTNIRLSQKFLLGTHMLAHNLLAYEVTPIRELQDRLFITHKG
jgi:hypothetical protein